MGEELSQTKEERDHLSQRVQNLQRQATDLTLMLQTRNTETVQLKAENTELKNHLDRVEDELQAIKFMV